MLSPIDKWIVLIPGYLQRMGQAEQGIPALWHWLWDLYTPAGVSVQQFPWDTDWDDVAETIFRTSRNGTRPRILLVAYSWGVGFGAVRLLRELSYRGIGVEAAVFSDGVFHLGGTLAHRVKLSQVSAYLTRPWGRPQIELPENVRRVTWYVQSPRTFRWRERQTWLRGHEIVWESGEPVDGRVEIERRTHRYMDECLEFRGAVHAAAESMFGRKAA